MPSNTKEDSTVEPIRYFPVMPSLLDHLPVKKPAVVKVEEVPQERRLFPRMSSHLDHKPIAKPKSSPIQKPPRQVSIESRLIPKKPSPHEEKKAVPKTAPTQDSTVDAKEPSAPQRCFKPKSRWEERWKAQNKEV